ncbi:DUF4276 family protein [Kribbella sindirgiensis]|uniref:DUF4276 family protein n=1 Tax=Kribbella sindirgiensis TaxID=1124744 RepID=A0A4R0IUR0_9ACTN|nr:DUF4276 family protein [Kribbella sindirgiensis]TCC36907.1 DUF4276 family protein [Kribbella sindirgiensis]
MEFRQMAVLVEGQTEAAFVQEILAPYLQSYGAYLTPVIVKTSRLADGTTFKGGGMVWKHYERDLRKLLAATHYRCVSILVDFYAYPRNGPGAACCDRPHQPRQCAETRVREMERAIADPRFVPYVVLHEFETWVIAAASESGSVLGDVAVAEKLQAEADAVAGDVELLNDSRQTAPSKRVQRCWPDYDKVTDGIEAIREAGLEAVIARCPGLRSWIDQLLAR